MKRRSPYSLRTSSTSKYGPAKTSAASSKSSPRSASASALFFGSYVIATGLVYVRKPGEARGWRERAFAASAERKGFARSGAAAKAAFVNEYWDGAFASHQNHESRGSCALSPSKPTSTEIFFSVQGVDESDEAEKEVASVLVLHRGRIVWLTAVNKALRKAQFGGGCHAGRMPF